MSSVGENWRGVVARVVAAAERAGRAPEEIRICAVTKYSALPAIREAVAAGARLLGESRVQDAAPKIEAGVEGAEWHLIGHLQRNKARRAVELFEVVQSVDSLALAARLADLGEERGRAVRGFLEVNTSGEGSKTGMPLAAAEAALEEIRRLPGLEIRGLMTMAPFTEDEEAIRKSFRSLRALRDAAGGPAALPELSMGMSNDFEIAVEEGATLVRVGTAIFG